jgi:hypothetical protein
LIVLMFLFSARIGVLIPKIGERILLFAGAAFAGAGFAALALLSGFNRYTEAVFPGVLLLGIGMTLTVAPLTAAVMSSVPETDTGVASAVNNAVSRLSGLMAVSLLSLLLVHAFAASLHKQLSQSSLPDESRMQLMANQSRLRDTPIPLKLNDAQRAEAASLLDKAFLSGFRLVMIACTASAWLGALSVLLLLPKPRRPEFIDRES